jgi:hypothetical protein
MIGHGQKLPAWLVGLIIAVLLSGIVLLVLSMLGLGDDPVVEGAARLMR